MGGNARTSGTVGSIQTMANLIDVLEELDGGGVTELSKHTGISKSTVHRHLTTLEANDYVTKDGSQYRLGYRLLELGGHVRERIPLWPTIKSKVNQLALETDERVSFVIENNGLLVRVYIQNGENAVRTGVWIGKRTHLHQVSGGKAILAHLSRERVDSIVDEHGLPPKTPDTIVDRDALIDELEAIRERGYAYNFEESIDGLRAVAVPVFDADKEPLGALCVAGPTHRMKGEIFEETIPNQLLGIANELELKLAYS